MAQEGPEFLKLPEKDWPTKGTVAEDIPLPERKQKFVGVVKDQQAETLLGRVDLARFSKWRLLVHATARVSLLYKRFKQPPVRHSTEPEMVDLMEAESSWIVFAQNELKTEELKKFDVSPLWSKVILNLMMNKFSVSGVKNLIL